MEREEGRREGREETGGSRGGGRGGRGSSYSVHAVSPANIKVIVATHQKVCMMI